MGQAIGAINPHQVSDTAQGDSWFGGFLDKTTDLFSGAAGAWLEYEKIQASKDSAGSSQGSVNGQPETSSQVQQPVSPPSSFMGISTTHLMMGAAALAAVVLLVKK